MILTLYGIEMLKTVRRLATWVTFLCFLVPIVILFGTPFYNARTYENAYFGFPDALPSILVTAAPVVSVFSVVLIVLLVCSEFDWRTSRQNIIDGLSRREWFLAKLCLLPTVAFLFYSAQLVVAATLAWLGTDPAVQGGYGFAQSHLLALGGVALGVLCYASVALFVSMWIRTTGPALGVALIYQVFENIVARTLRGFDLDRLADWLPFQIHNALFVFDHYLPPGSRSSSSLEWQTGTLLWAGAVWVTVFVVAAYLMYSKRDL